MDIAASAHILGSTGGTWAIIIVSVVSLAFFIASVQIANIRQERDSRHAGASGEAEPASGEFAPYGNWAGGNLPGAQAPEIPGTSVHEPVTQHGREARDESGPDGPSPSEGATRPAQGSGHALPAQRPGGAGRPARSHAGTVGPDGGEPGR